MGLLKPVVAVLAALEDPVLEGAANEGVDHVADVISGHLADLSDNGESVDDVLVAEAEVKDGVHGELLVLGTDIKNVGPEFWLLFAWANYYQISSTRDWPTLKVLEVPDRHRMVWREVDHSLIGDGAIDLFLGAELSVEQVNVNLDLVVSLIFRGFRGGLLDKISLN